ncbi:hypothetical protein [Exiguobacterium sp. s78]|uniref:hypothetical protein n=1 Tax=Exiguobacterium sp. s78 TaxID=2751197 RepID=UPI001BE8A341|nr:hypothetical protein [Exiguobacterium sp. s78]
MNDQQIVIGIGTILKDRNSGTTKMIAGSSITSYPGKPEELTYFFYDSTTVPSKWKTKFDYVGRIEIK